jgi:DNA gyrase/topoisomerase IV subunit A
MCLLTITENGYGKAHAIDEYRVQPETGKARSQSRGGKGRADIKSTANATAPPSPPSSFAETDDVVVVVPRADSSCEPRQPSIRECGRGTMGCVVSSRSSRRRARARGPRTP